jgi:hypothetical protein
MALRLERKEQPMKARVTLSLREDGELEIWINREGRDLLVRELSALSEQNDHFHLMPHEWWNGAEVDVSLRPYRASDKIISSGKVLFRTDDWDRTYFPQVMTKGD